VKEKFLKSYVLDRFQSSSEDLITYISSVVAATAILGFQGSESQLVHRLLQNAHPRVKLHLLFVNKPESVTELYSLTTTVAEAVAVEEQRKQLTAAAPQVGVSKPVTKNLAVQKGSAGTAKPGVRCWRCGEFGHLQHNCGAKLRQDSGPRGSGKAQQRLAVNYRS
jgi:hypothetical protein